MVLMFVIFGLSQMDRLISCHWSFPRSSENIKNPEVFQCFQGVGIEGDEWHEMG